jgi:hypothetical protein
MTTAAAAGESAKKTPKAKLSRRTKKTLGRNKRKLKLKTNPEFAKAYHEGKAKRSNDGKAAYRKKKRGTK